LAQKELPAVAFLYQEKIAPASSRLPLLSGRKDELRTLTFQKSFTNFNRLHLQISNSNKMAKSQDTKKTVKKEPLKTAKEKKADKRDKKNTPKRD